MFNSNPSRRRLRVGLEPLEPRCVLAGDPIISEFMAANDGAFRDGYDRAPDWVEIHNPTNEPIELAGYRLTDDPANLAVWTFPSQILDAGAYLVVFASGTDLVEGRDPAGFLHANFRIDREVGSLALVNPSGEIVSQFGTSTESYPEQLTNISYGIASEPAGGLKTGYMQVATPGAPNVDAVEVRSDFVRDTKFSVNRGFYNEPIDVEITTSTLDATIRYTTDGTPPSELSGMVYDGPVTISKTTILRAMAFKEDHVSTNVDTQSYLFLVDVLSQDGAGLPDTWGTFPFGSTEADAGSPVPANYEVDPEVVNDPRYADTLLADLRSLPTISLVLAPDDLWNQQTGIYSNPVEEGVDWERPGSIEMIAQDGTSEFQIDAGVRIHGGFGRRPAASAKHSFRLFFKGIYGDSKLEYPLFGDDYVSEFDTIVLRANYNYSWSRGNRGGEQTGKDYTLVTDRWSNVAQTEMGGLAPQGEFVHLFVNGLYWGVYNPTERPDDSFQASHRGGDASEYDVQNHEGVVAGDRRAWTDVRRAVTANPVDLVAVEQLVDVDNFIDYMILNQFGGNGDWPQNNWYASRRRIDGEQWQFHSWDAEFFFIDLFADRINDISNSGPGEIFLQLLDSEQFRQRFADRIHKHLFNDGALTPENNIRRLDDLAAIVDRAVVGESARWGDAWMNQVSPPRTRDDDWLPRIDELRQTYFPQRNEIVLQQYRRRGLYPQIDAPSFSQHGGIVNDNTVVTLSHPDAQVQVFYTVDGSDPRAADGTTSATAKLYAGDDLTPVQDAQIQSRAWDGTEWSALVAAEFLVPAGGDLNVDGVVDVADVDLLCQEIRQQSTDRRFDLNADGIVSHADHQHLIGNLLQTGAGDANLDGLFDSGDLIQAFQAGAYEDGSATNVGWESGDWDCDGEFTSTDLVVAFATGTYEAAAQRPLTVSLGAIASALPSTGESEHTSPPANRLPRALASTAQDRGTPDRPTLAVDSLFSDTLIEHWKTPATSSTKVGWSVVDGESSTDLPDV